MKMKTFFLIFLIIFLANSHILDTAQPSKKETPTPNSKQTVPSKDSVGKETIINVWTIQGRKHKLLSKKDKDGCVHKIHRWTDI
jgi:uncharacterized lipoprotein YajG